MMVPPQTGLVPSMHVAAIVSWVWAAPCSLMIPAQSEHKLCTHIAVDVFVCVGFAVFWGRLTVNLETLGPVGCLGAMLMRVNQMVCFANSAYR